MLWLCISLPQLPLEALQCEQVGNPTVVTDCEGPTRWVLCCNSAAERAGLKAAMNYTTALAVLPDVVTLERRIGAEQAALERLAAWAYQFSGTVILGEIAADVRRARSTTLWLEIGASLKLFGGFRQLIEQLEQELGKLLYTYRLGIAPTLEGAALLARAGMRIAITTRQALHERISELAASLLNIDPRVAQQLYTAGVRTIGLLLELPRDGIAKRFGPEVCNYLDRLTGQAADPRPAYRLPPHYDAHFEFEAEVGNTQALLFPLRRLLQEFAGFLRGRDTCVQRFTLKFAHREVTATSIAVGLSVPDRDAERFLTLVRERLEHMTLPAPTTALHLSADEFAMPMAVHADLLSGEVRQSEEFAHTIDRIAARLGEEQIHGLKCVADHRPEASWTVASAEDKRVPLTFPDRPLWLLPEPQPLSTLPRLASGPERIEGGWWDGGDVQRDYFIAQTNQGAALWIFQDLSNGSWHLHGFWS